ncbi:MAG TPA: preprotein translocase subunit YajC [Ruminiclostridium sp.]|nr:preprotein translocase subunit YajC [Ruminiclostridium sp.]
MMFSGNLVVGAAAASATSSSAAASGSTAALFWSFAPFVVIIIVFYFFLIRPQRKKEKQTQQMRNSLQVGDNVTTVGGVLGRVVSIKDDSIIIETGADRSKIQIKKWAIQTVDTIHDDQ